jgi:hypothetical protein
MNPDIPDLVVVGAGIAGSCVATVAREAGLRVVVVDAPPPHGFVSGSRAAMGLMRNIRLLSPKQSARSDKSVQWYKDHDLLLTDSAFYTSYKYPQPKWVDRYYLADVSNSLVIPDHVDAVVRASGAGVVAVTNTIYPARLGVVICAGPQAPLLGGPAFDHTTIGATFIGPPENGVSLRVHRYTQYNCISLTREPHCTRLGSSSVTVPKSDAPHIKVRHPVDALQTLMKKVGQEFADPARRATPLIGMRAHDKDLLADYEPIWLDDRLVRFAGLGKLGYSLAPAVAMEIVSRFTQSNRL